MENNVIYDAIQSVAEQTEYNGGGIDTLLNGRIVKSVQRGYNLINSLKSSASQTIPIAQVDADKTIAICSYKTHNITDGFKSQYPLYISVSQEAITVKNAYTANINVYLDWQVIEFY